MRIIELENTWKRDRLKLAAMAAALAVAGGARADDSTNMITWSVSGSTAMRNFTISNGFTVLEAGSPNLTLSNGTYTPGGGGLQLAPNVFTGSALGTNEGAGVRVEWHEQGSVEGILELVNDQVGYAGGTSLSSAGALIDPLSRNPTSGNPIRINRNNFTSATTINGYSIGSVNYNTYNPLNYNSSGKNLLGGQNRVQMAISDVVPLQGFSKTSGNTPVANTPIFALRPGDTNYGKGNALLSSSDINGLGTSGGRQQLVDDDALNMKTSIVDPATGAAYNSGSWTSNGVGNLTSKTVAVTATIFAANPGTGLTQLNQGDAQWLQVAGRLQNGADFNVSERDVNSGTRNVAALNTGVDPSWAVGANDDGNGNPGNPVGTASEQASIGSKLRFSGKTAGGAQLRPTVQNNRMALGPLGMSDAISFVKNNASANPLRALAYSNTATDAGATFVQPNTSTITDGSYVIWQNEQYATVRTPDANYNNDDSIKGDPNGDIAKLRNLILTSVNATFPNNASLNTPADQLLNNSFILPQMMLYSKATDGGATTYVGGATVNGMTHSDWRAALLADPTIPTKFDTTAAANVTAGGSSKYGVVSGVSSIAGADIAITAQDSSGNATGAASAPKGNYMFGNFNQNGVRDYSAVLAGQVAEAKLFNAGSIAVGNVNGGTYGTDVNNITAGGAFTNSSKVTGISTALDSMNSGTGPSKGDLVVLGDYNGDGKFDGQDLYKLAHGAAISDAAGSGFTNKTLTATAANFGDKVRGGLLRKNAALDDMQTATAAVGGDADGLNAARAFQRLTASANLANDPTGANAFNKFDVNRDGLVNRVDAQIVDHFIGTDYRNLNDQVNAIIATNGTVFDGRDANGYSVSETARPISLVDPELNDNGTINASDFSLIRDNLGTSALLDGDANFDGVVDMSDVFALAQNWLSTSADRWSQGDFDLNGTVNAHDLGLLALNWQQSSGQLGAALGMFGLSTAVPEPACLSMIPLAGLLMRRRRRHI